MPVTQQTLRVVNPNSYSQIYATGTANLLNQAIASQQTNGIARIQNLVLTSNGGFNVVIDVNGTPIFSCYANINSAVVMNFADYPLLLDLNAGDAQFDITLVAAGTFRFYMNFDIVDNS